MDIDERYKNGKIYKIVCNETDEVYYGSTIQTLKERLRGHLKERYFCMSKQILDRNNYYCELVEDYSCNNVYELETREKWYILNNECINKLIPARTKEEIKDRRKNYDKKKYENNKEIINEKRKEKTTCDICGSIVNRGGLKRHQKNKKCKSFI